MIITPRGGEHILVVEDEAHHALLLEAWLRFESYDVVSVRSAEAALPHIERLHPLLVLLDLVLDFGGGTMDGFQFLERRHEDPALSENAVIITSSLRGERDQLRGLRLGAADYLTKPFRPMEVSARVRNTIDGELAKRELRSLSSVDTLTGVASLLRFNQDWTTACLKARRHGYPTSVIMIDIDHFKSVNDQHGHAAGDEVLRAVAGTMREQMRESDLLGRTGGEEFTVLLTDTKAEGALLLAEKLRSAVEGTHIEALGRSCTISVGVASWPDCDLTALREEADRAMYHAKRLGRNQVRVAG